MKKLLIFIIMISVLITTVLWFKYSKVQNNYARLSNSNYLTHKIVKKINAGSYSNGFPVTVINDFSENEVRSVLFPEYMLVAAGGQIKNINKVINVKTARKYNCLRGVLLKKLKLERDTMEVGESQCLTVIVESLAGTTCNSKVFLYSKNIEHAPKSQFIPFEIASGSIAVLKWIITPLKSGKQTLLVSQGVYQELNNKSQQIS